MKMSLKYALCLFAMVATLAACKSDGATDANVAANVANNAVVQAEPSNPDASTSTAQNSDKTISPAEAPVSEEDAAAFSFEESSFDFGTIDEGDKVEHIFKFKNTSDNPLIISNARGSCGCTVPDYPTDPILPGEEGEILVKFDSKGKKGDQKKTVTLIANTLPSETILNISAKVNAAE